MGGVLVLIGIIWIIYQLCKDARVKPCSKNIDIDKMYMESLKIGKGQLSKRQFNINCSNGTYDKVEEKSKF